MSVRSEVQRRYRSKDGAFIVALAVGGGVRPPLRRPDNTNGTLHDNDNDNINDTNNYKATSDDNDIEGCRWG